MRIWGWRRAEGLNEEAQANPDRLLLSRHCHYFVIMVVGASLHVLLITDKGLGGVRANTKTELRRRHGETSALSGKAYSRHALVILYCLMIIA